jgi:hypothetical protein
MIPADRSCADRAMPNAEQESLAGRVPKPLERDIVDFVTRHPESRGWLADPHGFEQRRAHGLGAAPRRAQRGPRSPQVREQGGCVRRVSA